MTASKSARLGPNNCFSNCTFMTVVPSNSNVYVIILIAIGANNGFTWGIQHISPTLIPTVRRRFPNLILVHHREKWFSNRSEKGKFDKFVAGRTAKQLKKSNEIIRITRTGSLLTSNTSRIACAEQSTMPNLAWLVTETMWSRVASSIETPTWR